jgi:3',5'-cyclic AMP phosphodiesterase CpdA
VKLLHFSDPHVQLPRWRERSLRELGPLRALATVELWKGRGREYDAALERLQAIVRAGAAADHVVCTGDLTQLAHAEEFALAREALAPLRGKLTVIPGNHDRYPLGLQPNRLFEENFPEHASGVALVGDELALIKLDTPGEVSWPVISRGHARALDALAAALRSPEVQGRCKLVLVHHAPLRASGRGDFPWHSLAGAKALLRVAGEGGAQAILCGHIHERYDVPAAPGRARVLCAGSSTRSSDAGYWELTIADGVIASATRRAL